MPKLNSSLKRHLSKKTNNGSYIDTYGWILFKQKKYKPALEQLLKAEKLNPGTPETSDHIGDTYFALGKKKESEKYWREALKLYNKEKGTPGYPEYIKKLNDKLKSLQYKITIIIVKFVTGVLSLKN